MSIMEKIVKINPKYIYVLLILTYAFPIIYPLGIPIVLEEHPKAIYNKIEQLEGKTVFYEITGGLSGVAEIEPGNTVIIKHLLSKNIKIIFFCFGVQAEAFYRIVMDEVKPEQTFGAEYGTDYVFLGYIAGDETGQVGIMTDIRNTAPSDYRGTSIDDLPIMNGIETVDDVDLLIAMYTGSVYTHIRSYSVTGDQRGDRAWIAVTTSANVPPVLPFVDSEDVFAVLGGSVQGAEYEILTGFIGNGAKRTDIVSLTHLFQVVLVVITNIAYIVTKGGQKQ